MSNGGAKNQSLRRGASARGLLATLCVGFFMVILDTTIVNVAVPAIQAGLRGSVTDLQWVVNGYTLVLAALLLSAGSLCDRVGARPTFMVGLGAFGVGSALCAGATTLGLLIAARLLEGLGASLLLPAALALIAHSFPEPRERARAVGVWAAVGGAATALGPVVGGLLIQLVGWRSIFAVNVPIGVVGLFMAMRFLPHTSPQARRFDLLGQLLGIAALGLLTAALTEVGALGWRSAPIVAAVVLAVIASIGFIATERRAAAPMLPLGLFSSRTFSAATASGLLLNFGIYGQVFVLSLYFQHIRQLSAFATGVALLPFAGMTVFGPVLVGRLTARVGSRPPMVVGQALAALGTGVLAASEPHTGYLRLATGLVMLGSGFALTTPSLRAAVGRRRARPPSHLDATRGRQTALSTRAGGAMLNRKWLRWR